MTTRLEEALKGVKEADRNTLHWDKKALKGNKDVIKRDGYMLRGGENAVRK